MSKSEYKLPIPKTSFWAGLFMLLGVFAGFYISVKVDIEKLKAKQDYQDTTQQAERKNYEKVNEKLDFVFTVVLKDDFDADEITVLKNIATVHEEKPEVEITHCATAYYDNAGFFLQLLPCPAFHQSFIQCLEM